MLRSVKFSRQRFKAYARSNTKRRFLADVALLSISCFGGPQAHLAQFLRVFADKRKYLTAPDLMELNALCQVLPGPTSTQTLTAIAFTIGGPTLAFITLLIWLLPAVSLMTGLGIVISYFHGSASSVDFAFTRFIPPVAIAFVAHAAYNIIGKVIEGWLCWLLLLISGLATFYYPSPWLTPLLLLIGGTLNAAYTRHKFKDLEKPERLKINYDNFLLWIAVFLAAAALGQLTQWRPILLFENFYRNGSLVFGGGAILIPIIYNEFVAFKHYLSPSEFLSGYAAVQVLPGPIFAFCSYVGVLSMRGYGVWGGILGSLLGSVAATMGAFLPGTFLIFFIIRFWSRLKQYPIIKASLSGINAAGAGLLLAANVLMVQKQDYNLTSILATLLAFIMLQYLKVPGYVVLGLALLVGVFVSR